MKNLNGIDIDRIIEMAWEDRTTFDAIFETFGLNESEVISLMRRNLNLPVLNFGEKEFLEEKLNMRLKEIFSLVDLSVPDKEI